MSGIDYTKPALAVLQSARAIFAKAPGKGMLFDPAEKCHCSLGAIARACGATDDDFQKAHARSAEEYNESLMKYTAIHPEAVAALGEEWNNLYGRDLSHRRDASRIVYSANDERSPLETLGVFDAAIAKLKEAQV